MHRQAGHAAPCLPSHGVGTVHRKNCEPLVLGPALAMDSTPAGRSRGAGVWQGVLVCIPTYTPPVIAREECACVRVCVQRNGLWACMCCSAPGTAHTNPHCLTRMGQKRAVPHAGWRLASGSSCARCMQPMRLAMQAVQVLHGATAQPCLCAAGVRMARLCD